MDSALIAIPAAIVFARLLNPIAERLIASSIPDQPTYLVSSFTYFWFWNQLPVFLIGFAVYFALRYVRLPKVILWMGVAISVVLIALLPFVRLPVAPQHIKYALCFGALAFCLGRGAGGVIVNWPIRQLGKISYSAYLWHFAVLDLFNKVPNWTGPWKAALGFDDPANANLFFCVLLVMVTVVTAAFSATTYKFIEQPMIAVGSRIVRRRRQEPDVRPSVV